MLSMSSLSGGLLLLDDAAEEFVDECVSVMSDADWIDWVVVGGCFSECGDGFDRRLRLMTCEDKRWSDRVDLLLKVVAL